ncbi:lipopolysaccharide-induced tumor necrosis factor-alpha factor homolog [Sinocyclocheilus rhinocerous]|uniref:Lipopolysaccharide-induced tumor necrosis factor-alpha factor homolog n=1 Tax=Sinocyclocheilus rhinocerous TaxID=307959 RepID=A0A673HEP0_9TELE|nr:PREDICTED: lipopolysaccharide-induced tumor necrosis factor-alpha factor homolog [Sinocyclocheilus rhinocerous]XP_016369678.1 PREDICTED: lipopolysaccharide-induced tumor necrosis factor-alpha factor homolog [Sinocyclocheilus rhinocerous]XP_016369679.1 PREDICTED: lipopolysaccharide-induced tumor necrosis factor-alpha factor homolog [Sinocyclocheilus rhinocerous]XP_016369680.1 PREDICTED: lipopolysaccharide-induced tumor necrosis factor-alpha factor homolog [Sinocyclocheilus rhinocerous]
MEKDYSPPHYSSPHMDQTGINYPGQQAAYPSQAGPQAAPSQPPPYGFGYPTITIQPTMVPIVAQMAVVNLTDMPGRITCPHCMTDIITEIEYMNGLLTWLIFGSLVIFVCWLCCCIPFCVDACKDVKHTCPNCKNIIHIYKRL